MRMQRLGEGVGLVAVALSLAGCATGSLSVRDAVGRVPCPADDIEFVQKDVTSLGVQTGFVVRCTTTGRLYQCSGAGASTECAPTGAE